MMGSAYINGENIEKIYIGAELLWEKFKPATIFSGGRKGVWYDISDLSTLFQDANGTIPVTKSGDPVGLVIDKSGGGGHATQPISASRPTYRADGKAHKLEFDGVDDCLILPPTLNLSNGGIYLAMQVLTGATRALLANGLEGYICTYISNIAINNGGGTNIVDTPITMNASTKGVFRINKTGGYLSTLRYGNPTNSVNSVQGAPTALLSRNILGAFNTNGVVPAKADFYSILLLEQHLESGEKELMQHLADKVGFNGNR